MVHKFDPKNRHLLNSHERRELVDPDAILDLLPLSPHQTVADVGCGTGFFTLPLASRLSQGQVIALDIAEEMVQATRQAVREAGAKNVEVLASREQHIPVPAHSLDGVFLGFVLHEAEDKRGFLSMLRGHLKPGGWLAVLEWHKREGPMGPPLVHRLTPDQVRDLAQGVGLRPLAQHDTGPYHYLLLFRSPSPSQDDYERGKKRRHKLTSG